MASSWIIQDATQYLATTFQEWYYVLSADNIPPKNGWGTNPGDGATITNGVEPFPIVVYFDATCDNVSSEVKNISITTNTLQNNVTSTMGLPKKPPKEVTTAINDNHYSSKENDTNNEGGNANNAQLGKASDHIVDVSSIISMLAFLIITILN